VLIRRARRFFADPKTPSAPRRLLLAGEAPIPDQSLFTVPRPQEPGPYGRELEHISVTEFSQYLACPYRYYLRRIRKLQAVNDAGRELEPFAFGNILHKTLSAFGRDSAARLSRNERDIFDFLSERLAGLAEGYYGSDRRRPALRLQFEQARRRLRAFAAYQANLAQDGWRIVYAEDEEADRLAVTFIVDDSPLALVGRIDRIDYHDSPKTVRILDYKTADTAVSPEKTHRERQTWVNLQLPLYRHLWSSAAKDVAVDCTVELAYFNLPKTVDAVGIALAKWDAVVLEEADEVARRVVRNIRDEIHWPPVTPAPKFSEDFAAICLDNTLSAPSMDDGQGGVE
jgi:ATP-dependent helicase/nuclease subunit B